MRMEAFIDISARAQRVFQSVQLASFSIFLPNSGGQFRCDKFKCFPLVPDFFLEENQTLPPSPLFLCVE